MLSLLIKQNRPTRTARSWNRSTLLNAPVSLLPDPRGWDHDHSRLQRLIAIYSYILLTVIDAPIYAYGDIVPPNVVPPYAPPTSISPSQRQFPRDHGYDVNSENTSALLNRVGVVEGQPEVFMPPLRLIADVPYSYGDLPFHHAPQVWFDENTRRKIHVLSHSQLHLLTSEIPAENLPKKYGGGLEWEFDDPPNLDERAKEVMKDFSGKVLKGPWEK